MNDHRSKIQCMRAKFPYEPGDPWNPSPNANSVRTRGTNVKKAASQSNELVQI